MDVKGRKLGFDLPKDIKKKSTLKNSKPKTKTEVKRLIINGEDMTPNVLKNITEIHKFIGLIDEIDRFILADVSDENLQAHHNVSTRPSTAIMNVTMDDIINQIAQNIPISDDISVCKSSAEFREDNICEKPKLQPFIKVLLRETDDTVLYEQASITVLKDSEESKQVLEDNEKYDFLTIGKGRDRRRANAETQTVDILYKSRAMNTERMKTTNIGTYVSNYDMFDTYLDLQETTLEHDTGDNTKMAITTYKSDGIDNYQDLAKNPKFKLATMLTQRLLAGNIFAEKQKRFRNMYLPDPLSKDVKFLYRLDEMWTYQTVEVLGKGVSDLCWCPINGDILAVAYGIYSFVPHTDRLFGYICIWNIKNPVNPERKYRYSRPVTAIAFSLTKPQLLAVGFYDGTIEIRDIIDEEGPPVSISQRSTSPGFEPIGQIEWIMANGVEQLLAISQDGTITKYRMTSGPHLIGFRQMKLRRVEGVVEGLAIDHNKKIIQANRHPLALTLKIHPDISDTYFVGTDEGCLHKCSINYPHQNTETLQVHNGGVFALEFSPWSSKIFLTCGSDWCIRVWIEGVLHPLIHLSSGIGAIHCAYWSPIHSTIIIGVTKTSVEIWDLRLSTLKPASTRTFGIAGVSLTIAKFSNCGRSFVVGDEDGTVHVCALEDMPFPPHCQYKTLMLAIMKALVANPELTRKVQSLGFVGYPNEERRQKY